MSRSEHLLQIHIVVLVILSTLLLGNGLNSFFIPSIGITAAITAYVFTERLGWIRLHRFVANILTLAVAALSINKFFDEQAMGDVKLSSIANLLTYVQVVLLFQRKTPRLYWNIWVLSLLQVVVAAALSLHFQVSIVFFMFFMISLSAMMLMSVYVDAAETNEQARTSRQKPRSTKILSAARMRQRYVLARSSKPTGFAETNLRNRKPGRLISIALTSGLIATIFAWVLFCSVPRHNDTWYGPGNSVLNSRVGFSEKSMRYNHSASITNRYQSVFRASFQDEEGKPIELDTEPYFSGMIIQECRINRDNQIEWAPPRRSRRFRLSEPVENFRMNDNIPEEVLKLARQRIVLEPSESRVLFTMKPHFHPVRTEAESEVLGRYNNHNYLYGSAYVALDSQGSFQIEALDQNRKPVVLKQSRDRFMLRNLVSRLNDQFAMNELEFNPRLEKLLRKEPDYKGAPYKYQLTVPLYYGNRPLPATPAKSYPEPWDFRLPPDAKSRIPSVFAAAQEVVDKHGQNANQRLLAYRMSEYFTATEEFTYTLDYSEVEIDPTLDPLEDFMRNRKTGHCEYYAGALAAMLRSQNIPSRIVRGYKGGEYNNLGGYYQVRQSDAHAWVEAYLPIEECSEQMIQSTQVGRFGAWYRLDPIIHDPTKLGYEEHEKGWIDAFGDAWGYARTIWEDYLIGMDAREQQGNLFAPQNGGVFGKTLENTGWVKKIKSLKLPTIEVRTVVIVLILLVVSSFVYRFIRSRIQPANQARHKTSRSNIRSILASVSPKWARGMLGIDVEELLVVDFYENFLATLGRHHLQPSIWETPQEFVQQSLIQISATGDISEETTSKEKLNQIGSMLQKVTDAFYRVRFGGRELTPEAEQDLDQTVQQLHVELTRWEAAT